MSTDTLGSEGTYVATEANPVTAAQLNRGDGVNMATLRRRRSANPAYREAFNRALDLYEAVLSGNPYAALRFQEQMSTSDFPQIFGDVIDRQLYDAYTQMPVNWTSVARRGRVRDFRPVKRYTVDGAEAVLDTVAEGAEYPAASLADAEYTYQVAKKGRRVPMTWEAWLNGGDLDAFRDLPTRLANAARRTEERFVTDLFAGSTGPDGTFYSSGHANVVTSNPALSIQGLQTAFTVLGNQRDTEGNPIYVDAVTLMVPPALEVTALNILNATEIRAATGGGDGTGNDQLTVTNWMRNKCTLVVNPWLPIISSSSNGNTSWYLFANPNAGRPALEVGFLINHETPEIWMKAPDAMRVGGGFVDPEMGDFDTDSVQWRVRHIIGGSTVDYRMSCASNGSGS